MEAGNCNNKEENGYNGGGDDKLVHKADGSGPGSTVVGILQGLKSDEAVLKKEREALLAERAKYAPVPSSSRATTAAATAILASTPRTPMKCSTNLAEIAKQERRGTEARARAQKAMREAQLLEVERARVVSAAEEAANAAFKRQTEAEQHLQRLLASRQQEEAEHNRREAEAEADTSDQVARINAQIEAERHAADARCREIRREIAEQSHRAASESKRIQADFAHRHEQLERSLADHDTQCQEQLAAIAKLCQDAEEHVNEAWRDCHAQEQALGEQTDATVNSVRQNQNATLEATNKRLAELETILTTELEAVASRERAMRSDRSAEDNAKILIEKAMDEMRGRKSACDAALRSCGEEIGTVLATTAAEGDRAVSRATAAQVDADRKIMKILQDLEEFCRNCHEGKILDSQAQLRKFAAEMRAGLNKRLQKFCDEAEYRAQVVQKARLQSDLAINEIREKFAKETSQKSADVIHEVAEIRRLRDETQAETQTKLWQTQEQMLKYISSMQYEMEDTLKEPDSAELTLMLPFRALTPLEGCNLDDLKGAG